MLQLLPLVTVVLPMGVVLPLRYKLMVAVAGLLASMRVQLPVTAILLPAVMALFQTGAAVQVGASGPKGLRLIIGWALITVIQASAVLA